MIIEELSDFVFSLLYALEKYILYLIDFTVNIFSVLSGLEKTDFNGESQDILIFFTESTKVNRAFYSVLLIGVVLLFVFAAVSVIKSEGDEQVQIKSKGRIVLSSFKGFILIILMPFIMLALVYLSSALLSSLSMAVNGEGGKTLIGGELFVTSAYSAYTGDEGIRDYVEQHFISGEYSYMDESTVKKFYSLDKINYVTGILIPLVNLLMLFFCTMSFTERIFVSLFLYILSPLFSATYPLDGGYRFREFKDLLIGELLSSYGIMIMLSLIGIIMPEINLVRFADGGFENGLIKVIILTGGIYSVTKGDRYISRLVRGGESGSGIREIISDIKGGTAFLKGTAAGALSTYKGIEKEREQIKEKGGETHTYPAVKAGDEKVENLIRNGKKNT